MKFVILPVIACMSFTFQIFSTLRHKLTRKEHANWVMRTLPRPVRLLYTNAP